MQALLRAGDSNYLFLSTGCLRQGPDGEDIVPDAGLPQAPLRLGLRQQRAAEQQGPLGRALLHELDRPGRRRLRVRPHRPRHRPQQLRRLHMQVR